MGKMTSAPKSVDVYMAGVPQPARAMLTRMRVAIRAALPKQAVEVISYRMPAFKLNNVLVWYAAFKDHCSLFPTGAVIGQFKSELAAFKISKGTVQFPLDKPLPIALVRKLVKARLQMIQEHPARRKRSS
jgi:uncharacterized protein YdhG (YjbR/CyaY superfamily)